MAGEVNEAQTLHKTQAAAGVVIDCDTSTENQRGECLCPHVFIDMKHTRLEMESLHTLYQGRSLFSVTSEEHGK